MSSHTIAVIATYPARIRHLAATVGSLLHQVDKIVVVANEYKLADARNVLPSQVEIVIPSKDLKDTGKFLKNFGDDCLHFLCDDDIIYPPDYSEIMIARYERYRELGAIIGLHGVTYSDFFEGKATSRLVRVFSQALDQDVYVNQLGSGTILCRGDQLPPFSYMESSARYVDLRYAVFCQERGFPRICIRRAKNWLQDQEPEENLFNSFTSVWPPAVTREAQKIAGLRFLPRNSPIFE